MLNVLISFREFGSLTSCFFFFHLFWHAGPLVEGEKECVEEMQTMRAGK